MPSRAAILFSKPMVSYKIVQPPHERNHVEYRTLPQGFLEFKFDDVSTKYLLHPPSTPSSSVPS